MQVKVIENESGQDEWVAIEMQGTIEGACLERQFLGNFAWNKDGSEAVLVIEHHLLEGKVMELNKPLMVISVQGNPGDSTMIVDGVITRKVVFKNRPKPIISETNEEN